MKYSKIKEGICSYIRNSNNVRVSPLIKINLKGSIIMKRKFSSEIILAARAAVVLSWLVSLVTLLAMFVNDSWGQGYHAEVICVVAVALALSIEVLRPRN